MNKNKPINIILLGDPNAGKATQAGFLIKKYKLFDLDMGAELRKPALVKKHDYAGRVGKGILAKTVVVQNIFRDFLLNKIPERQGILFNGTPKKISEAKLVAGLLKKTDRSDPLFIYLYIPFAEIVKRARLRVEKVNGRLTKRPDDSPEAMKNRMKYYRTDIARVIKFFNSQYKHKKISGLGSRQEVKKRIADYLSKVL